MSDITPEQKLAVAVLHRAILDAHGSCCDLNDGMTKKMEADRARTFLLNNSADLRLWCDLAGGICVHRLNAWARRRQRAGWPRGYIKYLKSQLEQAESYVLAEIAA